MRELLAGITGPLREAYERVDWDASPVGPVERWSPTLLNVVGLMLHTRFPITLLWGPQFTLLYNQAYVEIIGDKHPVALGRPAEEIFPEIWGMIGPMMQSVGSGGEATWLEDEYVPLHRHGFLEECYFTYAYSPVTNRHGEIEGVVDIVTETTASVISRRRMALLSRLADRLADVERPEDVANVALPVLHEAHEDLRAVDIHLHGRPVGGTLGLPERPSSGDEAEKELVEPSEDGTVAWLPLGSPGAERAHLVVLLSPQLAPNDDYLDFLRLVAASLSQALDRVRARTAERRTAETQRSMTEAFQRSLLPHPRAAGLPGVAVRYQPAVEVAQIGGDWYDFFDLDDGSLTVVIGDVAGHDQQAAAAMAQVRNILRGVAFTRHPDSPSGVLQGLERAIGATGENIIATAVLAQVTTSATHGVTLTWANAGHPPPVLLRPDGTTQLLDPEPDLLIGLDHSAPRIDTRLRLTTGSTVVLYTDGLIERRDASVTDGLVWLEGLLQGRQDLGVEEICDFLLSSAGVVEDDVALLVLRV